MPPRPKPGSGVPSASSRITSTARRAPAGTEPASTSSPSGCSAIASSCAPGGPTTAVPSTPKFGSRLPPGWSRATANRCTPPTVIVPATRMRPSRNRATSRAPARVAPSKPMVSRPLPLKERSGLPEARRRTTRKPRPSRPATVTRPSLCSATAEPAYCAPACPSSTAAPPPKPGSRSPGRAAAEAGRAKEHDEELRGRGCISASTRAGVTRVAAQRASEPAISAAISATSVGVRPTRTPLASSASAFAAAVPLVPETIAPAWPMVLPGGAVKPAM